jgi:hypothetical protein
MRTGEAMSVDAAFRDMARNAVAAAFSEQIARLRAELERPRMLPIDETGVNRRVLNAAATRGEIRIYRIGHATFIDAVEFYEFVRKVGLPATTPDSGPGDEIGELIAIGDRRRDRRKAIR